MQRLALWTVKPVIALILVAAGLMSSGTIAFTVLLWPQQLPSEPNRLSLPTDLLHYKEWMALLDSPSPVPMELWIRCMAPTLADWARAREKHGPHTEHYIQVYGNQVAVQTLRGGKAQRFVAGAVIAKEKLARSLSDEVEGVAFMIKRGTPQFAKTGGWEFVYYPRSGDSRRTHEACAACHHGAASTDYVFGQYPSPGNPLGAR